MTQQFFLSRKTFGISNYFLIALGFAVFAALLPRAAREALHSNTNKAEDWLPKTYTESSDLRWFRQHFISEGFVLVTWDGCTLGNAERLNLLQEKLSARIQTVIPETFAAQKARDELTGKWFRKIISGPSMIRELTEPPLSLSYAEAVRRLEGALVGPPALDAQGNSLGDDTRVTCLVAYLSPEGYKTNRTMRQVVDEIARVATKECGVPEAILHMGGPTVDNVTIDRAGEGSFTRLAALSGIVGLAIAYWCFRDLLLTGMVVAVGVVSAAMSLAFVFYYGVLEVLVGGLPSPVYGKMDAVLMSMAPLVYVLGLSGAIHLVNYYRDARVMHGLEGAVERACQMAWKPCFLVAFTASLGFGCLVVSDIVPIRKFGGFSGVAVVGSVAVLFSMLPVYLHRFPPRRVGRLDWKDIPKEHAGAPPWAGALATWLTQHHALVTTTCIVLMCVVGFGITRLQTSIRLLKLLDSKADLILDYAWAEEHLGYLVPMEVVIIVPPEQCRSPEEHAEEDGQRYRMTMLERLAMIRRILARVESLDDVSRVLSVATYAPEESQNTSAAVRRGSDYTTNETLVDNRDAFRDFLQEERSADGQVLPNGRELWRLSARVTALKDIDYGQFDEKLRKEVEPVLTTYRQRDELVSALHQAGGRLEGARLCLLFFGKPGEAKPAAGSPEGMLADLLRESGVTDRVEGRAGSLAFYNLAQLENPQLPAEQRAQVMDALREQSAVVVASDEAKTAADRLLANDVSLVNLPRQFVPSESAAMAVNAPAGPRTIRSMYTGIIPLVFKTQRQLMVSLNESAQLATFLIVVAMAIALRSGTAGVIAMLPNLFPNLLVFGALGWLGIKIDIGIMMTASIGLGVSVDSTLHQLAWVGDGLKQGMNRRAAVLMSFDRCASSMLQSALVSGLGLVVFAASDFTPTRQFGYLMIAILAAALMGDLIMLPALIAGPLGKCFEPRANRKKQGRSGEGPGGLAPDPNGDGAAGREAVPAVAAPLTGFQHDQRSARSADNGDPPQPKYPQAAEMLSPANAALRDKLRSFRRSS
jgi:predicted RND superfamily exporter protein